MRERERERGRERERERVPDSRGVKLTSASFTKQFVILPSTDR